MKTWKTIGVLLIIGALLAGVTACNPFAGSQPAVNAQLAQVTRGNLSVTINGDGKIYASREVNLSFTSAGRMTKVNVKRGDQVKKGDTLAILDTSALILAKTQAQVALSQGQVALSQAKLTQQTSELTLTRTKDSKTTLELALYTAQVSRKIAQVALSNAEKTAPAPDLEAAIDRVNRAKIYLQYALDSSAGATDTTIWDRVIARAQSDLVSAQSDLDRITAGVDADDVAIKKMQLEAADKTVTQAQKNLDDVARDTTLQEAQVAYARDAVTQAQKTLEFAQESLNQTQKLLDEATLKAPFDGIVTNVGAEEQEFVSTLNTIVTMLDPASVALMADIDEVDIAGVKVNQNASIGFDALPDTKINGTVAAIYPLPKIVGGVVQYEVKINFPFNDNPAVKIGMSAKTDIVTSQSSNVLLVPSRAIETDSKGNPIVNVRSDGKVQPRTVVTGLSDGLQTEITSGLSEGESVVITLRAGTTDNQGFFFGQ